MFTRTCSAFFGGGLKRKHNETAHSQAVPDLTLARDIGKWHLPALIGEFESMLEGVLSGYLFYIYLKLLIITPMLLQPKKPAGRTKHKPPHTGGSMRMSCFGCCRILKSIGSYERPKSIDFGFHQHGLGLTEVREWKGCLCER